MGMRRRSKLTCAAAINVFGLVANLVGVILLFRYGMPYRVRTKGETYMALDGPLDQEEIKADRRFDRWGKLGLFLIVLGTIAQIGSLFL
jgi:hypothetical protein